MDTSVLFELRVLEREEHHLERMLATGQVGERAHQLRRQQIYERRRQLRRGLDWSREQRDRTTLKVTSCLDQSSR